MKLAEPNQANRRIVGLSTAIISVVSLGLLIIGAVVTGPA